MAFGDTSKSRIAYIAESAFGTTPATPTFKELRRTGGGLETRKGTNISGQVSLVRDIRQVLQLSQDVVGDIQFEFNNATFDDFLEAVLGGTWSTNVLNTGNTARFFTFEETVLVGATSNYMRFLGCSLNTMALNIGSREMMTGSIGIMGKQQSVNATSILSGATYTGANAESVFTADKVASLSILGGTPIVRSLSMNFNNNLRVRPAVGTLYSDEFGMGAVEVTGRIEAYFASGTLPDAILNHGTGALSFTVGVDANKKYTFSLPVIQIGNGTTVLGGQNDDVMVNIDFQAVYDVSSSSTLSVTRLVA